MNSHNERNQRLTGDTGSVTSWACLMGARVLTVVMLSPGGYRPVMYSLLLLLDCCVSAQTGLSGCVSIKTSATI